MMNGFEIFSKSFREVVCWVVISLNQNVTKTVQRARDRDVIKSITIIIMYTDFYEW